MCRRKLSSLPRLKTALFVFLAFALASCVKGPHLVPPPVTYPGFHEQKIGASAKDLLSDERFNSLTVEIQYMAGFRPEDETVQALKDFLQQYLCKPDGINVKLTAINTAAKKTVSRDEALRTEITHRTQFTTNHNIAVYFLISGATHPDRKVLGMAYRNTSAVIYGGAIKNNAGSNYVLTKAELETAVILHEMGHLLNLGNDADASSSNRSGKEKRQHCQNELCLMYWATETRNLPLIKRKGKIPQLDEHCRKLLLANGGMPAAQQ